MGEAKRRAAEIAQLKSAQIAWRNGLSEEELIIAHLAERLDERVVRGMQYSGGCYHLAFFMTRYLSSLGIQVTPVVGWVNDGLWKGMTSHAWIEYDGKKSDVSLTFTEHDTTPTGALVVQDRIVRRGQADYVYFRNDDPQVAVALQWMETVTEFARPLVYKKVEHARMVELANTGRIDEHFSNAPTGNRYTDFVAYIS